jgi:hypothetical protein
MEPMCIDNHAACFRVVEARHDRVVKPLVNLLEFLNVAGIVHIERIVKNDDGRSTADEGSIDRGRIDAASCCRRKISDAGPIGC